MYTFGVILTRIDSNEGQGAGRSIEIAIGKMDIVGRLAPWTVAMVVAKSTQLTLK